MASVLVVIILMALVMTLSNAMPKTPNEGKCTKDIIIILDVSTSIGKGNFNNNVKPFLKNLVNNPDLNVSPEGTHVAFVVFSSKKRTKLMRDFNQDYNKSSLDSFIRHGLKYDEIKGSRTRTDVALHKASEVFQKNSPFNHRPKYDDIILLITDGNPWGLNAEELTLTEAKELKNKGVAIIGVGIGNSPNMDILSNISSPGLAKEAKTFDALKTIEEELVAELCVNRAAGTCTCSAVDLGDWIIETDKLEREVTWDTPRPECTDESMKATLHTTKPNIKPGQTFRIGRQDIEYTYNVGEENPTQVKCDVSFEVKANPRGNLCGGKAYSRVSHICCCGVIQEKKDNFQCCGTDYISKAVQQCCPGSTIRNIDQDCSGPLCKCPQINLGTKYLKEVDQTVSVTWAIPRPSCGGRLRTTANMRPGQKFTPGAYLVQYLYKTTNQFNVTCRIRFQVKACSCPLPVLKFWRVVPGNTTTAVTWKAPSPTCSEAIRNTKLPPEKPGQLFAIGLHTISYTYNINNQFDLRCEVKIEVRGALCRDKGYDPSKEICCCGTLYNIMPDYVCCGQDYFSLKTHHCCRHSVVRQKAVSCPRQ